MGECFSIGGCGSHYYSLVVVDMINIVTETECKRRTKEFLCEVIDRAGCFSMEIRNHTTDIEDGYYRDKAYGGLKSIELRFPTFACMIVQEDKYFMEGVEVEI